MERVFGAPQQHLPPLLRLNGITTMAANRYLVQTYLPEHNARFRWPQPKRGAPSDPLSAPSMTSCASKKSGSSAGTIACATATASCRSPSRPTAITTSRRPCNVHEYPDGGLAVSHGPRCLARYRPTGKLAPAAEAPVQRERPADLAPVQRCAPHGSSPWAEGPRRQDHTACGGGPPAGRASLDGGCAPRRWKPGRLRGMVPFQSHQGIALGVRTPLPIPRTNHERADI